MNQATRSFLLVLLIESIAAIATFLKRYLMRHMESDQQYGFSHDQVSEFA